MPFNLNPVGTIVRTTLGSKKTSGLNLGCPNKLSKGYLKLSKGILNLCKSTQVFYHLGPRA